MRLLFTYYVPSGGVETLNRTRCIALMKAGIETHLLYLQEGAGKQNIADIPLFISNLDHEISSLIQTYPYDAIICTSDYLMLPRLRSMGHTGHIIFEAQGFGMISQARELMGEAAPFIRSYANAAMCTPTPHLMQLYHEFLSGFPQFFIQNAVDTETFSSQRPDNQLEPAHGPVLAWVGRLEKNKNWLLYIETAVELIKSVPNLQLWMFEDANLFEPQERAYFDRLVSYYQLAGRLTVRSNIPHHQMPLYFSAIDQSGGLLFSTSHVEGFGYAVAEAMSCSCPVLATTSDGVQFFIKHNRTGKLIMEHNPSLAAMEALELITASELRDQIKSEGRQHIREHFSPHRYVTDVFNILRALGLPL
ncbi:glycosyltransferase family 4 protein [Paenibacillus sp. GCM10012307]|uniref:Glycosyltransferase family 4 protein n=1 Tax=Paenibacillus roseus TaxID=2798579 RepID=A0A934MR28_9BACL|nr:glycosyltransferase family 4 protein [Paenibacillus roseus]MBJ6363806.1 glycosyltransferase family 4 protein [Paenibacillus roseus]